METKVAGGGGARRPAGEGGSHGQVLGDRRLAAERELKTMSGAFITSSVILMLTLAGAGAVPPPWVSRARETGEQLLRARLFQFLSTFGSVQAAAILVILCMYQLGAAPSEAERALAAVRMLFLVVLGSMAAEFAVVFSDSWGETAVWSAVTVAAAAIPVLCVLGKLKGFALKIGKAF